MVCNKLVTLVLLLPYQVLLLLALLSSVLVLVLSWWRVFLVWGTRAPSVSVAQQPIMIAVMWKTLESSASRVGGTS